LSLLWQTVNFEVIPKLAGYPSKMDAAHKGSRREQVTRASPQKIDQTRINLSAISSSLIADLKHI
jgi:hypothetical protein